MLQESSSNPTAERDTADASGQGNVGVVADGGFWHLHQEGCSAESLQGLDVEALQLVVMGRCIICTIKWSLFIHIH